MNTNHKQTNKIMNKIITHNERELLTEHDFIEMKLEFIWVAHNNQLMPFSHKPKTEMAAN